MISHHSLYCEIRSSCPAEMRVLMSRSCVQSPDVDPVKEGIPRDNLQMSHQTKNLRLGASTVCTSVFFFFFFLKCLLNSRNFRGSSTNALLNKLNKKLIYKLYHRIHSRMFISSIEGYLFGDNKSFSGKTESLKVSIFLAPAEQTPY